MVDVISYVSILAMIAAGVVLMGLALLLMMFTRAGEGALVCMLCGTVFSALGGVALLQQLRRTYTDLQERLRAAAGREVRA